MTPLTATPAFEHVELAPTIPTATSELVATALSDMAPWLYSALSQLHNIERHGQNLPGVGDLRIADPASTQMKVLLSHIAITDLPTPLLYPISGRGAGMKWNVGKREVEFTIFASGATVMAKLENDELLDDSELNADPNFCKAVNSYLAWLIGAR
jgi:hypothetical protein